MWKLFFYRKPRVVVDYIALLLALVRAIARWLAFASLFIFHVFATIAIIITWTCCWSKLVTSYRSSTWLRKQRILDTPYNDENNWWRVFYVQVHVSRGQALWQQRVWLPWLSYLLFSYSRYRFFVLPQSDVFSAFYHLFSFFHSQSDPIRFNLPFIKSARLLCHYYFALGLIRNFRNALCLIRNICAIQTEWVFICFNSHTPCLKP